jgi:trk system potassium uptake protein TrkH
LSFRPVAWILGRLLIVLALALLVPALCAAFYGEGADASAFFGSAAITALAGGLMAFAGRGQGEVYRREGILIVVGGWVLASVFGALPYLLTGTLVSPVDALFESASGFTTTGATVLLDIEAAGRGVLFWRCFTQWLGGMGIIVLFVALLPELGPGARFLYKLEVPGPTAEALLPHIRDTASVLWRLYLMLSAAETLLLMLAGMDLYDALSHTFTTLSTGGFSPRADSIAAYDSVWIHLIIIVFMVLAGMNFSLYFGLRHRKGWKTVLRDPEVRTYLSIIAGATVVITISVLRSDLYSEPGRAILDSLFQVTSIQTTTGFATADFQTWPNASRMLLVALMFIGGCAGSTSGSMKVMRMVIGLKAAWREVRLIFSPSAVISVMVGRTPVPEGVVRSVAGFFILYLSTWGVGTVALTLIGGESLVTAATAAAATLGNIGPGLEAVGPVENFAFFPASSKLIMTLLMWMGRLEVYSIMALVTVRFWRR